MRFGAFLIIALVHGEDGSDDSEDFLGFDDGFGLVGNGEFIVVSLRTLTVTDDEVVTGGLRGVMARSNSSSLSRSLTLIELDIGFLIEFISTS